jgi:hypothetical protein
MFTGEATGLKNVTMSYEKYDTMIVRQHHVRIAGWPQEIVFNISKITSSSDLRFIREGLDTGAIRWVPLSREEIHKLGETYLEERPAPKKRKAQAQPSKKQANRKGGKRAKKSAEVIDDSDQAVISDAEP